MNTQHDDDMRQVEASAEAAWRKMRVVTRVISIFGILILFDVGKALWPSWLAAHQLQAFLVILFLVILSMLTTPHVVAAVAKSHSNPK